MRVGVRYYKTVGLFHGGLELLLKVFEFFGIGVYALVALFIVAIVVALHFVHGLLFERIVFGADGFGSLKGHVLKHVCNTGFTAGIVDGARIDVGMERYDGRLMAFEDDEVQSVGESEFGDALFEVFKGLGGEKRRAQEQCELEGLGFHARLGFLLLL